MENKLVFDLLIELAVIICFNSNLVTYLIFELVLILVLILVLNLDCILILKLN